MIILFDENETLFSGLGLGVLRDAISCTVTESLNDEYTLEMEYPVKGNNFSQLQLNRIIYCRPNPYSSAQPFRIYSITKPLDGRVTVAAYHVSYDMNDVPVSTINGQNIQDALNQIQNGVIIDDSPFKLYTDMTSTKKFKTTSLYNMRALLMGSEESILEKYDAEIRFDKWNAYITKQRGRNRGAQVRYAKNMTELSHELNYERLYNGVYPFYHKETTSTTSTTTSGDFKQVYIVGKKPYQAGWLSYTAGGTAYQPVDESPVQIASDGDWKGKVYCWDSVTQRYIEKVYNETVTLIQGVTSPDWIKIDWGSLPNIVCKAATDGYFKTTLETTWTYHKTDETVFEGSITDISSLATNMILYFAEVIPSDSTSTTDTDTSVVHIELPEKIIWLTTDDAKAMTRNRVLMLDLSSEFSDDDEDDDDDDDATTSTTTTDSSTDSDDSDDSDVPTVDELRAKAEKYIKKNKIGTVKFNTSLSFVDLASTTEKEKYKDFEQIELGDTIKVVYNELGINIDLRVITTTYDALKNAYDKVELGEKDDTLSASSVQNGDDISSLTNDSDYATTSTVNKLIAKTVTADYIQAQNAKLTSAQIAELSTARIKCTGILEASQLELDKLVATMLIADDAEIANTLSAGQIKVAGDISINSGQISITNGEKVFEVTREGDLTANSVTITGGSLNINNGTFEVTNDGLMTATGADISGRIQATDGIIGGFTIGENAIYNSITGMEDQTSNGVYLGIDGIKLGDKFSVTSAGTLTTTAGVIGGYTIDDTSISIGYPEGADTSGLAYYPGQNVVSITKNGIRVGNFPGYKYVAFKEIPLEKSGATSARKALPHTEGTFLTTANNIYFYITTDVSDEVRVLALEFCDSDGKFNDDYKQKIEIPAKIQDNQETTQVKVGLNYDTKYYYLELTAADGAFSSITMETIPLTGIVMNRNTGEIVANNVNITGGKLTIGDNFKVTTDGKLTAVDAELSGKITAATGTIGGFTIKDSYLYNGDIDSWTSTGQNGVYVGVEGIRLGKTYKITPEGAFSAGDETTNVSCGIDANGALTARSATIVGKITAESGYIGTEDAGFYISSNCICSRAFDPQDLPEYYWQKASVKGLYIGNDAIRIGQAVTMRKSGSQASVGTYDSASLKIDFQSASAPNWNGLPLDITFDASETVRFLRIDALDSNGLATGSPMQLKQVVKANATSVSVTIAIDATYFIVRIMSDLDSSSGNFTNVSYKIAPTGVMMARGGKLTANGAQIYGSFDGDVNITGGSLNINNGVFSVDKNGNMVANAATIKGNIVATSGYIGDEDSGFTIASTAIYNGVTSMSDTSTSGIYVGVDGIKLGTDFAVTSSGSLTSSSGRIGGFIITSSGLFSSTDTQPSSNNLLLRQNGRVVMRSVLFNDYADTSYSSSFPGAMRMGQNGFSYSSQTGLGTSVVALDYLLPWGVVTAYSTDGSASRQNVMPFDSVLSISPAMRGVSEFIKYFDSTTSGDSRYKSTYEAKRVGPHFGLYIWVYHDTVGDDQYAEKSAADMGFVSDSPYLFGVVSQKNWGDVSQYVHQNKLSTCVTKTSTGYTLRVYNDDGSANDGFVCFVIGIINDNKSTNNAYYGSRKLSDYAGSSGHEYPFNYGPDYGY